MRVKEWHRCDIFSTKDHCQDWFYKQKYQQTRQEFQGGLFGQNINDAGQLTSGRKVGGRGRVHEREKIFLRWAINDQDHCA